MNNASFNTKVQVLKPNVDCKNRFMGMDKPFMFFWCHFGNLDNTQLRLPQCPLTIM